MWMRGGRWACGCGRREDRQTVVRQVHKCVCVCVHIRSVSRSQGHWHEAVRASHSIASKTVKTVRRRRFIHPSIRSSIDQPASHSARHNTEKIARHTDLTTWAATLSRTRTNEQPSKQNGHPKKRHHGACLTQVKPANRSPPLLPYSCPFLSVCLSVQFVCQFVGQWVDRCLLPPPLTDALQSEQRHMLIAEHPWCVA